jgi:branched-chain amino acid transport system permease protein
MDVVFSIALYGLSLGFIYALIAIGLSLIFGYMGILNVAHGTFYALGAYLVYTALKTTGNFWLGVPVGFSIVTLLGAMLERTFMRRLYGKDIVYTLVMTLGLQLIFIDTIKIIWGLEPKPIGDPIQVSLIIPVLGVSFPMYRLVVIFVGLILYVGLWLFLTRTMVGKVVIAGIEDLSGIQALGINPLRTFTLIFALGAGLAAVGGALYSPIIMPFPYMGFEIILHSFAIVVMGGLANLKGTLIAAIITGEAVAITGYVCSSATAVVPFVILAVVLAVKPEGLFGT